MSATLEYLQRQVNTFMELIEKKDELILKLQNELQEKTNLVMTVRTEQNNFRNSVKDYVIEAVRDREMMHGTAEALAELCDFELTKTVTVTARVDFEVELEVPFDTDANEVANTLEFSVDSFDYSIDDFTVDTYSIHAEDNIS